MGGLWINNPGCLILYNKNKSANFNISESINLFMIKQSMPPILVKKKMKLPTYCWHDIGNKTDTSKINWRDKHEEPTSLYQLSLFFVTLLVNQEYPLSKTSKLLAWLNLSNMPCTSVLVFPESAICFNLQNPNFTIACSVMFFMAMLSSSHLYRLTTCKEHQSSVQ